MTEPSRPKTQQPLKQIEQIELRSQPVQKRSRETVHLILEAAAELVDEVGVVGFTTNLLAERADIRIRTIYRYFPNKLGILTALIIHLNEDFEERVMRNSEFGDLKRDWRELVGIWIDDLLTWTRDRPGARLHMGWMTSVPEILALQDRMDDEWARGMMDAMRKRGVKLPPKQLYAMCRCFNETLDSMTSLAAFSEQEHSDEIIDETRHVLIRYLEPYLD